MTRFAAPLAYNCLHVIRMHEYLPQGRRTVFAQKMSPAMADVPVFGTDFNTWFPLVTAVYCTLLCGPSFLPNCAFAASLIYSRLVHSAQVAHLSKDLAFCQCRLHLSLPVKCILSLRCPGFWSFLA